MKAWKMRNPTRRSRKIGLTQGGRVKNGVAMEKSSRIFRPSTWQRLHTASEGLVIVRENPSRDFLHPVTKRAIREVLQQLPDQLTAAVRAVVLRRLPSMDEQLGIEARLRYGCIILNAFPKDLKMVWRAKPPESAFHHYGPWCDNWLQDGDQWAIQWDMDSLRRYYLYHLLLHEIGHLHGPRRQSHKRREDFAENFALEWARRLGQLEQGRNGVDRG